MNSPDPMSPKDVRRLAEKLGKELMDRGLIIEAGFAGLKLTAYPNASPQQLEVMRDTFFAGAQHLFDSIMSALDEGSEDTPQDVTRMANIDRELRKFEQSFKIRHGMT